MTTGASPIEAFERIFYCSHANTRSTGSRMGGGGRTVYETSARAGSSSLSHSRSNAPLPPHPFVVTHPSQPGFVCYQVFIVFTSEREIMTIAKHPQSHSHMTKKPPGKALCYEKGNMDAANANGKAAAGIPSGQAHARTPEPTEFRMSKSARVGPRDGGYFAGGGGRGADR